MDKTNFLKFCKENPEVVIYIPGLYVDPRPILEQEKALKKMAQESGFTKDEAIPIKDIFNL